MMKIGQVGAVQSLRYRGIKNCAGRSELRMVNWQLINCCENIVYCSRDYLFARAGWIKQSETDK